MHILSTLAIILIFVLTTLFLLPDRTKKNGEWRTIGASDYRYRRWMDGKWEYRDMTREEADRHQEDNAW